MNSILIPEDIEQIIVSIIVMICRIGIYVKFYFQDNLKVELDKYFQHSDLIDIKLKDQICNEVLGQNQTNQILISKLSPNTIKQLQTQQRFTTLQEYFTEYSIETLNKLVDCCEDIWCSSGQTIVNKNISDDSALYLIKEGQFTVQIQPKQILKTLNVMKYLIQVGQTFGEYSFYSQQPRVATIVCKDQGHLLKVPRQSFLKCLNYNEKQLFCLSQDRLLYQNINPHNQKCYCCEATNHLIVNCPKLTYKPAKFKIIREMNHPHIQYRFDSNQLNTIEVMRKRKSRSVNAIRQKIEGQSIDVDLFYYMFCDKWNQENLDDSDFSSSEQEIEQQQEQQQQQQQQQQELDYGFDQEILTQSLQITQSVMGDVPIMQNQYQDVVPFPLQLSNVVNQFQEGDRDIAQSFESSVKLVGDNQQKPQMQKLQVVNKRTVTPQKQQPKSLKCIPESEHSCQLSINDDLSELSAPERNSSEIDRINQEKSYKKRNSTDKDQLQHKPNIFTPHHLLIPTRTGLESSKKIKSLQSYASEKQKSKSNPLSNFYTLSNLYNQQSNQADHSGMSVINNGFDKLSKFEIYYPEYNYDPQIQAIQSYYYHQI